MHLMTLLVSFSTKKLQAVTDSGTAKATDENLTSENWEYILVWNQGCQQRSYDQTLRNIRTSAIESAQRTRGLFYILLNIHLYNQAEKSRI